MPEDIHVGTVICEGGKYLLEVEAGREELPAGLIDEAVLKRLVGQKVEVLYTAPKRFVVGLKGLRRPPIICYIPPPDWRITPWAVKGIEDVVRANLAKEFLKQGLITKEISAKLNVKS